MNKLFVLAGLVIASVLTANATPIHVGSETALQTIINNGLNAGHSLNVNTAQVADDAYWTTASNISANLLIEIAGYSGNNSFGIYKVGSTLDTDKLQIFAGSKSGGASSHSVVVPASWTSFGFYLKNTTNGNFTWYSDAALNAGGQKDHFVTFQGEAGATMFGSTFDADDYVFAIEDLNLGDQDYNDMVVLVQNLSHPQVPDTGATLALLGLGFGGMGLLRRRLVAVRK